MSRPAHHSIVTLSLNDLSGSKHLAQSLIVDKKLKASGIKAWDIWKRTPSQAPPLGQSLMSSSPPSGANAEVARKSACRSHYNWGIMTATHEHLHTPRRANYRPGFR
jgi:hypothetical protein